MKKRILGRTGLEVSEIGFGGLFFINESIEAQKKMLEKAFDMGINYVDTAPGYRNSEEMLGIALEGIDRPLVLSTKIGYKPDPFNPQDKDLLLRAVENSLKNLKRDYIDIFFIHEPDRPGQFDWWSDPEEYYGPVIDVLDELKKDGVIGHTGLGGTTAYELANIMKTGRFDVVLTAFNYSALWREAEIAILPEAKKQNMGVVIGSPLQQGALACRYDDQINNGAQWMSPPRRAQYKALYAFLDEIEMSLPEIGLRFVISNPDISCVLMGARSMDEVKQNIEAAEKGPLPDDILTGLNEIAAMVPFRPYEEPFGLPFNRKYYGPARGGR